MKKIKTLMAFFENAADAFADFKKAMSPIEVIGKHVDNIMLAEEAGKQLIINRGRAWGRTATAELVKRRLAEKMAQEPGLIVWNHDMNKRIGDIKDLEVKLKPEELLLTVQFDPYPYLIHWMLKGPRAVRM